MDYVDTKTSSTIISFKMSSSSGVRKPRANILVVNIYLNIMHVLLLKTMNPCMEYFMQNKKYKKSSICAYCYFKNSKAFGCIKIGYIITPLKSSLSDGARKPMVNILAVNIKSIECMFIC